MRPKPSRGRPGPKAGDRIHAARMSVAALLAALCASAAGAGQRDPAKPSEAFRRLNKEYYGLADSIEEPSKWREATAQRRAFIAKLRKLRQQKPELGDELQVLVSRAEEDIPFDGIRLRSVNNEAGSGSYRPLGGELDVVCWVEANNLHVAIGNPTDAPKKVRVRLSKLVRRGRVAEFPTLAQAELTIAAREVVLVHFDGIPTTGDAKDDRDYRFRVQATLLQDGKEGRPSRLHIQGVGGWGPQVSRHIVGAGEVEVSLPSVGGFPDAHSYTVYVPRRARCMHTKRRLPLRPVGDGELIEAEHGRFFSNRVARLKLTLPESETYDLIHVPDLVARVFSGSIIMETRAPSPRFIQLGKSTKVRRATVSLPKDHRLDAELLSDDPPTRADQLARRLPSELWTVRSSAEAQLAAIGAPAVPSMAKLLCSNSYTMRKCASRVLARIGEPAAEAVGKALKHSKPSVRDTAAETLGRIGGRGVDLLLQATLDSDPDMRIYALRGLVPSSDPRREDAVALLLKDANTGVRGAAASALASIYGSEGALEKLVPVLKDRDPGVRSSAALAIARADGSDRARDILVGLLKDTHPAVRRHAVDALVQWNAPAGWPRVNRTQDSRALRIARLLKDLNAEVRQAAAYALFVLRDPRVISALVEALRDDERRVRQTVASALGRICRDRKLAHGNVRRRAISSAMTLLSDAHDDVRSSAAHLLGHLGATEAAEGLILALDDSAERMRVAAKRALTRLGYRLETLPGKHRYRVVQTKPQAPLPRDITALVETLAAGDVHRRAAARDALVQRGKEAIEPLNLALRDRRLLVRTAAAEALGRIGLPAARAALEPLLASGDELLARAAARELARSPDARRLPAWLKLLESGDFVLRAIAAEALGRLKNKGPVEALIACLNDPRTEVRRKAIWALGEIGDPRAVDPLFERYVNRRGGVPRAKAVYEDHGDYRAEFPGIREALILCGGPAILKLVRATGYGWSIRDEAVEDLVRVGRPAVPALLAGLVAKDYMVRRGAARVLGRLRPAEAVEPLLGTLAQTYAGREAVTALAAYGDAARPKLKEAIKDFRLPALARASAAALLLTLGDRSGENALTYVIQAGDARDMNELSTRMGSLRRREFLPFIAKALERPDASQTVTYAAAYCGGRDAVPLLKKALTHPNKGVRSGAQNWIRRLSKEDD